MSRRASTRGAAAVVGLAAIATAAAFAAPAPAPAASDTGFEICTVAASCKEGRGGVRAGELASPLGIAADLAGNVYVVDSSNNRIQKFDSSGNFERAWGKDVNVGGGTGFEVCTVAASCQQGRVGGLGGEFDTPSGVTTDAAGNVYVVDPPNERVQEFDSSGNFERAWGKDVDSGGGTGFEICIVAASCKAGSVGELGGEFYGLAAFGGIAADPAGNVYVAEGAITNRIQKFDSSGNWERAWGKDVVTGGGTGAEVCTVAASCKGGAIGGLGGEFDIPEGVGTDAAGKVYVSELDRIQKFDSSGNWERTWGKNVDSGGGTGFVVCTVAVSCKLGTHGVLGGELDGAYGVAADPAGTVFVADTGNQRIQAFDPSGSWQRAWGQDVVAGGGAGFEVCTAAASCKLGAVGGLGGELSRNAFDLAADAQGHVYVSDSGNNRIQKFDSSGNWERAWGRDVVADALPPTCTGIPATIVGTDDRDVLRGTRGRDVIAGLGGKDKLSGLGGNDVICGGGGRDTLKGGKGNDKLYGGGGKDTLKGGPGKDRLKGGPGKDRQVQ